MRCAQYVYEKRGEDVDMGEGREGDGINKPSFHYHPPHVDDQVPQETPRRAMVKINWDGGLRGQREVCFSYYIEDHINKNACFDSIELLFSWSSS